MCALKRTPCVWGLPNNQPLTTGRLRVQAHSRFFVCEEQDSLILLLWGAVIKTSIQPRVYSRVPNQQVTLFSAVLCALLNFEYAGSVTLFVAVNIGKAMFLSSLVLALHNSVHFQRLHTALEHLTCYAVNAILCSVGLCLSSSSVTFGGF